ncbi:MAG: ATP-binding protein [Candidatus Eremiobacteraeota bacterium]|nr:ATP-binding protein [Candidatus Eremiobacteraeota bacterium]
MIGRSVKLQRKLIGFLLIVSLVPLAIMGVYGILLNRRHLIFSEKYKVASIISLHNVMCTKMLNSSGDSLIFLSQEASLPRLLSGSAKAGDREAEVAVLSRLLTEQMRLRAEKFSRLSLLDGEGRELFRIMKDPALGSYHQSLQSPVSYGDDPLVQRAIALQVGHIKGDPSSAFPSSAVITGTVFDGASCIVLLTPFYTPSGNYRGGLIAVLDSSFIKTSLLYKHRNEMIQNFNEFTYLATDDGSVLTSTDPSFAGSGKSSPEAMNVKRLFSKADFDAITGKYQESKFDKGEWVWSFDTVFPAIPAMYERPGGKVRASLKTIVRVKYDDLFKVLKWHHNIIAILLGASTIMSLLSGVYLTRKFLIPINIIMKGTEEVSGGNLDYEITIRSDDEFEALANRFNSMTRSLKEIYANIEQKVVERTEELAQANRLLGDAKEQTARDKERIEAVLNSTKEGILMVDREGSLILSNRACLEHFSLSLAPEGQGKPWNLKDLITPAEIFQDPARYSSDMAALVEHMDEVRSGHFIRLKPFLQIVEWFSAPVVHSTGSVLGRIIALRDITREKEVERMKDEFVSIVSHELRTPMTSISGSLSLVLDGTVGEINEDQKELLDIAKNNTTRLIRLINDILDISKIESGKIRMKKEPVDINKVVEDSVGGIGGFAENYGVKLSSDLGEDIPSFAADRDRLIQVVTNLLSNSIKFSPRGGTVFTKTWSGEGKVFVSVRDEGTGIPKDYHEKIFEKFQQVDSSTVREKGGTGLGLPICRAIIQEHGGSLWVESEPDKGSTFTFFVPLAGEASDKA